MAVQDNTASMQSVSGVRKFLREVKIELKKVTWPTRQQLIAYTGVVLVAVMLVCVLIWIFDSVFALAFRTFLRS
ncbi:MAG: preprotein translocase subunit SecE [Acidaminococcales bacterium]|nr:preprotein translocase subunit SecE [Acidaminococcales bacterium]